MRAVYNGTIVRGPCERCGSTEKVEFHHPNGYDRENRLNVIQLCASCHRAEHKSVA
jgi:hypothetical protein